MGRSKGSEPPCWDDDEDESCACTNICGDEAYGCYERINETQHSEFSNIINLTTIFLRDQPPQYGEDTCNIGGWGCRGCLMSCTATADDCPHCPACAGVSPGCQGFHENYGNPNKIAYIAKRRSKWIQK